MSTNPQIDWFAQNAPKPQPSASPAADWFDANAPKQQQQPGAVSRFVSSGRQALGLPANPVEDITGGVKFATEHPGEAAKQIAMSPIEGYKSAVNQQYQRAHDAYERGDYGQALLHGIYYLLAPVGGANLGKASEQAKEGDVAGSLGTTAGTALPFAVGSPQARTNIAVPVNAARSVAATGLEKSAKPVSTLATIAGAAHELAHGRPESAVITAALGKPAISRAMTSAADFIRPGEAAEAAPSAYKAPGLTGIMQQIHEASGLRPMPVSHALLQDAIKFLNSPGMEGEAATTAFPPDVPRGVIQRAGPPKTAAEIADRLETKSIQEAMREDLEKHGQSALSQERRTFFANNDPSTPKGDLIAQANQVVYEKAAKNGLPKNASSLDVAKAAAGLKFQDEHLAEILQKSIEQIQAGKAAATK